MNITAKINDKLFLENVIKSGKRFWCYPVISNNSIAWDVLITNDDNLSNWIVVLYKMKMNSDVEFDIELMKKRSKALPHGIFIDGVLYHGNNCPIPLEKIAEKFGCELGVDCFAKYDKRFGISKIDLELLEKVINKKLNLQYTVN